MSFLDCRCEAHPNGHHPKCEIGALRAHEIKEEHLFAASRDGGGFAMFSTPLGTIGFSVFMNDAEMRFAVSQETAKVIHAKLGQLLKPNLKKGGMIHGR